MRTAGDGPPWPSCRDCLDEVADYDGERCRECAHRHVARGGALALSEWALRSLADGTVEVSSGCAAAHPDRRGGQHVAMACSGVRATHVATGTSVLVGRDTERSAIKMRGVALALLEARVTGRAEGGDFVLLRRHGPRRTAHKIPAPHRATPWCLAAPRRAGWSVEVIHTRADERVVRDPGSPVHWRVELER